MFEIKGDIPSLEGYGGYVEALHHKPDVHYGWAVSVNGKRTPLPPGYPTTWAGQGRNVVSLGTMNNHAGRTDAKWMQMTPDAAIELAKHLILAASMARRNDPDYTSAS